MSHRYIWMVDRRNNGTQKHVRIVNRWLWCFTARCVHWLCKHSTMPPTAWDNQMFPLHEIGETVRQNEMHPNSLAHCNVCISSMRLGASIMMSRRGDNVHNGYARSTDTSNGIGRRIHRTWMPKHSLCKLRLRVGVRSTGLICFGPMNHATMQPIHA